MAERPVRRGPVVGDGIGRDNFNSYCGGGVKAGRLGVKARRDGVKASHALPGSALARWRGLIAHEASPRLRRVPFGGARVGVCVAAVRPATWALRPGAAA